MSWRFTDCTRAAVIASVTLTAAACGGSPHLSSPSPSPLPQAGPCEAIGQYNGALLPIINGTPCDATRSSVVLLKIRSGDSASIALCSGTIIAPRAVLTAAHCLSGDRTDVTIVRGGAPELVSRSFRRHPDYRPGPYPLDVGVVSTDQDLGRRAIPLLISRTGRIGESAILAGWGRDENGVPAVLRAGAATIDYVGESFLTTRFKEDASAICGGDSGGPLLLSHGGEWVLAGVASTSFVTAELCRSGISEYAGVRASAIASFILSAVPDTFVR